MTFPFLAGMAGVVEVVAYIETDRIETEEFEALYIYKDKCQF